MHAQSTRVHVGTDACARRRRIAEPSRTVQQAQAAGRAGEAAKNYSSRNSNLREEQRERQNFRAHGKSRARTFPSPFPPFQNPLLEAFDCFSPSTPPFCLSHLCAWAAAAAAAGAHAAHAARAEAALRQKMRQIRRRQKERKGEKPEAEGGIYRIGALIQLLCCFFPGEKNVHEL